MNVEQMTKKDFNSVPRIEKLSEQIEIVFDSFVIIPTNIKHDSGYRIMHFCLCKGRETICVIDGCSDSIYMHNSNYGRSPSFPNGIHSWKIDCLPKSGYLRVWNDFVMKCGGGLSSFDVFVMRVCRD